MIGIVGKPNVGKSLLFNVWSGEHAKTSNYPFCTIDPNKGCGWVEIKCPCAEFEKTCGRCTNGQRSFPVQLVDIAGLVEHASEGHGMGNRFLAEILEQEILLEIVDATGELNNQGEPQSPSLDQVWHDIEFIPTELVRWLGQLIERNGIRTLERLETFLRSFHISPALIHQLFRDVANYHQFSDPVRLRELLRRSKTEVLILNKVDRCSSEHLQQLVARLKKDGRPFFCYSALLDFGRSSERHQGQAIERMKALQLRPGSIILREILFDLVGVKIIFPVKHLPALTDDQGSILPDMILLPRDGTCRDLAYRIHEEIGTHFIRGIDAHTHLFLSATTILTHRQVVRIVAKV